MSLVLERRMCMSKRIKISEEERELRQSLKLPLTKELRYMRYIKGKYKELKVLEYQIAKIYQPSGVCSLRLILTNGEQVIILASYFAEMQKPSFEKDMQEQILAINNDTEEEDIT